MPHSAGAARGAVARGSAATGLVPCRAAASPAPRPAACRGPGLHALHRAVDALGGACAAFGRACVAFSEALPGAVVHHAVAIVVLAVANLRRGRRRQARKPARDALALALGTHPLGAIDHAAVEITLKKQTRQSIVFDEEKLKDQLKSVEQKSWEFDLSPYAELCGEVKS